MSARLQVVATMGRVTLWTNGEPVRLEPHEAVALGEDLRRMAGVANALSPPPPPATGGAA